MALQQSGSVYFHIVNGCVFDILPGRDVEPEDIRTIHVPRQVTMHHTWHCYWFPELQEIIADPDSPQYVTYDGALYTREGRLLYVPHGKRMLRLATFIREIGCRAFRGHDRLEEITTDPDNSRFLIRNGCLFSEDCREVYFAANPERVLYLPPETEYVSEDVYSQPLREIRLDGANPFFELCDDMLISRGRIEYTGNADTVRIPPSVKEIPLETAMSLYGPEGKRTVSAEGHPLFRADGGMLFDLREKKLIFLSPSAHSLTVPDGYSLGRGSLMKAAALAAVSVPADMPTKEDPYNYHNSNGIREQVSRGRYAVTVRLPNGRQCTFPGELYPSLAILRRGSVEVKAGTEILYLEVFLAGGIVSPDQRRSFAVSAFQILKRLIDDNDVERFRRVIADGRLITRRNIRRLKACAERKDRAEIAEMLNRLRFQQEKI